MRRAGFIVIIFVVFLCSFARAQDRLDVKIVTDEADAVLAILEYKAAGREITEADWEKVFSSEGYTRLKKREISMKRSFEDADFRSFVLSDALSARREALAETLRKWREADVSKVADLAFAYLPRTARIRAKIYPVIKPRENSFVFDLPDDPAIFLYIDPAKSKDEFENHLAHELHHIGFGTACPGSGTSAAIKKLPEDTQKVLKWIGAFGEGFAMLAAAGGPDIHPHLASSAEDRARWDKDVTNFNNDLKTVERFFLDLAGGKLSAEDETKTAVSFYGVQGSWYTVGWQMAVVIERTSGREKLIECMCDQRKLLSTYNTAVGKYNKKHKTVFVSWSAELLKVLN